MKVVFVVSGVCLALGPAATPTRSWRAAGLEVKKERSSGLGSGAFDPASALCVCAVSTVERIDRS